MSSRCRKRIYSSTKSSRIYEWVLNEDGVSTNLILALIGTLIGLILTLLTSLVLPEAVPVQFNIGTLIIFGIVLILTSLVGSLFSVLSIRK